MTPTSTPPGIWVRACHTDPEGGQMSDRATNHPESIATYGAIPELLPAPGPESPYVEPIAQIHRGADAFVTFHRKLGDEWQDLGALRVADLQRMFPEFARELLVDSYYSVNSFFRDRRRADACRYLNCAFVDIDVRDAGVSAGTLFGRAYDAVEAQRLPVPSLFSLSGRGCWFFWLLVDPAAAGLPPRAWPEKVLAHEAIECELIRRLSADVACKDISHVTRVPGSLNSKSGTAVAYGIFRARFGTPEYTLESLSAALGIELPQLRATRQRRAVSIEGSARGMSGWRALWQQRYDAFELLRRMRGGFHQGHRNRAAYLYAVTLSGCGLADSAVRDAVARLGKECHPPLSPREIADAVGQSRHNRRMLREQTYAIYLEVTPDEARLIPEWDTSALQVGEPIDMNFTNTARIALRKKTICEIVAELDGRIPSSRQMSKLLARRGIAIGHVQVNAYYKQLDLRAPHSQMLLLTDDG